VAVDMRWTETERGRGGGCNERAVSQNEWARHSSPDERHESLFARAHGIARSAYAAMIVELCVRCAVISFFFCVCVCV
jgi:hypothetical protein